MSEKAFHWGIVGLGKIAHKFAQDLALIPNARIGAVVSQSASRAHDFAQAYGVPHSYTSLEAFTQAAGVDAVYIATEHTRHAPVSIACLDAGLPVLCEKPLGMNLGQVEQMIAAARKSQTFFMEALWTRFLPITHHLLQLLEAEAIGPVFSLTADFGFKASFDPHRRLFNQALGGGALLDIGIYPVFLATLLFGAPSTIRAAAHLGQSGVDEEEGMLLGFPEGQMAHLLSTFRATTPCEATLYGEKGKITLHTRWHEGERLTIEDYVAGKKETRTFPLGCIGYRYEAEHVMDCLGKGMQESPLMPHAFSLQLMATLDAIRRECGIVYPTESH